MVGIDYLNDLVARMSAEPEDHPRRLSVSWDAYREAEKLSDLDAIGNLVSAAESAKKGKVRQAIYFCIGCIGSNTQSLAATSALLEMLGKETLKGCTEAILSALEKQHNLPPDRRLLDLAADETAFIRHAAINTLGQSPTPQAEERLCSILQESTDPYDLVYASRSLEKIGTAAAIPFLVPLAKHPKEQVASAAICTLASIGDIKLLPVFLQGLKHRTVGARWSAMIALGKHSDETVVKPVLNRAQTILRRKRTVMQGTRSELTEAFDILWRFKHENAEIPVFFETAYSKHRDRLFEHEVEWLKEHLRPSGDVPNAIGLFAPGNDHT
jgi:hypothetical protein